MPPARVRTRPVVGYHGAAEGLRARTSAGRRVGQGADRRRPAVTAFVLDASSVLASCFEDEGCPDAGRVAPGPGAPMLGRTANGQGARMTLITTTAELAELCQELAREPFVALDTEFMRDRTYFPKLCLVQLAGRGAACGGRSAGAGDRSGTPVRAAGGSRGAEGVPCRAPGHRDLLPSDRADPPALVRHPARGDGLRLWRGGRLRDAGGAARQGADRQELALHRLGAPPAERGAAGLCDRRRDASARGVPEARPEARGDRAQRLGRAGAGRADRPRRPTRRSRTRPGSG